MKRRRDWDDRVSGTGICLPGRKSSRCEFPAVEVAAWTRHPTARRLLRMRHRIALIKELPRPPASSVSDPIRRSPTADTIIEIGAGTLPCKSSATVPRSASGVSSRTAGKGS